MLSITKAFTLRWTSLDKSWRFAIAAFLAVRLFYGLWSWVILTLQPQAVQNFELSSEPVLTVFDLQTSQRYIYLREVQGQVLTFQPSGTTTLTDQQTGSLWDSSTGTALQGPFQGTRLLRPRVPTSEIFPYHHAQVFPVSWLAIWQRFDANWYTSIAETGYGNIPGDSHFPPFFPILIRMLTPVLGSGFLSGLLISHLAALYAIKLLYDLFREWAEETVAGQAVIFFLIFPTSFFLFSAYSESLFLVTSLLALHSMTKRAWIWAGLWTFCAVLTRLQGIALLLPMVYLMWIDSPFLRKSPQWFGLATPAASGLLYLYVRSAQSTNQVLPLAEPELHARLAFPLENYWYAIQTIVSGHSTFIDVLNWIFTSVFVLLLIYGWRNIPIAYNLYMLASLFLLTMRLVETQPLNSMLRYSLTLFPSFLVLGLAGKNPWAQRMITYTFIPLNLYLSAQFFLWGWVA